MSSICPSNSYQRLDLQVRIIDRDITFHVNIQGHKTMKEAVKIIAEEYNESFYNVPQFEKLDPDTLFIVDDNGVIYSVKQKIGKIYHYNDIVNVKCVKNMDDLSIVSSKVSVSRRIRRTDCPIPTKIRPNNNIYNIENILSTNRNSYFLNESDMIIDTIDNNSGYNNCSISYSLGNNHLGIDGHSRSFPISAAPSPAAKLQNNKNIGNYMVDDNEFPGRRTFSEKVSYEVNQNLDGSQRNINREQHKSDNNDETITDDPLSKSVLTTVNNNDSLKSTEKQICFIDNFRDTKDSNSKNDPIDESNDKIHVNKKNNTENNGPKKGDTALNTWQEDSCDVIRTENSDTIISEKNNRVISTVGGDTIHQPETNNISSCPNELSCLDKGAGIKKSNLNPKKDEDIDVKKTREMELGQIPSKNLSGNTVDKDTVEIIESNSVDKNTESQSDNAISDTGRAIDEELKQDYMDISKSIWEGMKQSSAKSSYQSGGKGKISPLEKSEGSEGTGSSSNQSYSVSDSSSASSSSASSSSYSSSSSSSSGSTPTHVSSPENAPSPEPTVVNKIFNLGIDQVEEQNDLDNNSDKILLKEKEIMEISEDNNNKNGKINENKDIEDPTKNKGNESDIPVENNDEVKKDLDDEDSDTSSSNSSYEDSSEQVSSSNSSSDDKVSKSNQLVEEENTNKNKGEILEGTESNMQQKPKTDAYADKQDKKESVTSIMKTPSKSTVTIKGKGNKKYNQTPRTSSMPRSSRGGLSSTIRGRGRDRGGFSGVSRTPLVQNTPTPTPVHHNQYNVLDILGSATESGRNAAV